MPKRGPYGRTPAVNPPKGSKKQSFLKEWRLFRDMTIEQLSEKAHLSVGSISAVERNLQGLSDESRERLAKALRITPGMLLEVNPDDDTALWGLITAATPDERDQIAKVARALVKGKR